VKSYLLLTAAFCGLAVPCVYASSNLQAKSLETATVVSIHRQELLEPLYYGGDNASDAPLQSQAFSYDVAVRTACQTYVTHYESPYDYFPTAIAVNSQIPIRVEKHDIAFDLGFRQMRMPIAHISKAKTLDCQ